MAIKLVFDTNNLLFRVHAVNSQKSFGSPEEQAGLALHTALMSFHKYYKKYKPDQWALTFEGKDNWRKTYTKSAECVSGNIYKSNRVKDASMEPLFALIESFRELMSKHTSAVILSDDQLEGDDCFSAYVQENTKAGHDVIGISGDRDFIQLYKCPNFKLINPDNGEERNQPGDKKYEPDLDYWMFLKCFRGDPGDYVLSAYPKVRETKIRKAYEDEYAYAQLMNETWDIKDEAGNVIKKNKVGPLYEENKLLMDLFEQPPEIKEKMVKLVKEAEANISSYSQLHFLKFLGKHKLNAIADKVDWFEQMLASNTKYKRLLEEGKPIPSEVRKGLVEY